MMVVRVRVGGLSPRARGKLGASSFEHPDLGSIPAGAGETLVDILFIYKRK